VFIYIDPMDMKLLYIFCFVATFSFGQTQNPTLTIVEVVNETAEIPKLVVDPIDEGTNDPESTGSVKYVVNGKVIYIKELPLIRIEQIEK
jgi:hypothetical protein